MVQLYRRKAQVIALLVSLVLLSVGCIRTGISPPPCGGPSQPPCHDFLIIPSHFYEAGRFSITLFLGNAALIGPVTCDSDVTISLTGPASRVGNWQEIPASVEIPSGIPQEGGTLVPCYADTNAGTLPFTISIGPRPPKGHPPQFPLTVLYWSIKRDGPNVYTGLQDDEQRSSYGAWACLRPHAGMTKIIPQH